MKTYFMLPVRLNFAWIQYYYKKNTYQQKPTSTTLNRNHLQVDLDELRTCQPHSGFVADQFLLFPYHQDQPINPKDPPKKHLRGWKKIIHCNVKPPGRGNSKC